MVGSMGASDLAHELAQAGYPSSERQLERWRARRLLDHGKPGVAAAHPGTDLRKCIAIKRVLEEKDDLDFAGMMLWAAGFDVDERFWRKTVDSHDRLVAPLLSRLTRRFDDDQNPEAPTAGDWLSEQRGYGGLLEKIRRRLGDASEFAVFAGVMLDVGTGTFAGFEHEVHREESTHTRDILISGLAMERSQDDHIGDKRLRFDNVFQLALRELAEAAHGVRAHDFSDEELCAARDDIRNILRAAFCLHQGTSWFLGPDAFGLRFIAQIAAKLSFNFIAALTPAFARLRRVSSTTLLSNEIHHAAEQAESAWIISDYFFRLQKDNPEYRKVCGPDAWKLAFRDSVSYKKIIRSLHANDFPTPNLEPWRLWKSASKTKKMPTGLLVMSIGAPSKLAIADIMQSADSRPTP